MTTILPIETIADATDKWIQDVVRQYLKEDVHFVEIKRKEKDFRDGFMSEILLLDILIKGRDTMSLVVKVGPQDEDMKHLLIKGKLGEAEASFYKAMYSHNFLKYLKELNIILPLPVVVYCEMVNDVFTLVMENLTSGSVKLSSPSPGEIADLELTKLAIEAIAIMHAIGYSYIEQFGVTDLKAMENRNDEYILYMSKLFDSGIDLALKKTKISDKRIIDCLHKLKSTRDYSSYFADTETEMQPTIIHGDYWIGQLMYNKLMKKMYVLDWQYALLGNPACDIVTFLAVSSDIPVYKNHFVDIVQTYTKKLMETLQRLKCSIDISYEQVLKSVNNAWPTAFLMIFIGIDIILEKDYITVEKLDDLLKFAFESGILK